MPDTEKSDTPKQDKADDPSENNVDHSAQNNVDTSAQNNVDPSAHVTVEDTQGNQLPSRKISTVTYDEDGNQVAPASILGSGKTRKVSEVVPPAQRMRKISFIDTDVLLPARELLQQTNDARQDLPEEEEDNPYPWTGKRESHPFLEVVKGRFTPRPSCTTLASSRDGSSRCSFEAGMASGMNSRSSMASRPSFANRLASRPSMVSLKETMSKVNLHLYPEKGSFVARTMSQSFASMPNVAVKAYIITQVLAAISVSIGSMAVGFTAGWTSPALESMAEPNSTLSLTKEQQSWVGSLMPLSALTGSIIGGYLINAIGRKMLICITGPPFILAYILMGSAVNVWMLYAGRVIAGICVGFLTLSLPVYLGETIQTQIRGTLGLLPTTLGNGGILICFTVGAYVNWSWLAYVGAIIPGIFLLLMIFVPETPRWYISKGREEEAYKSLCWLRGTNADVDSELEDIITNHELSLTESSSIRDIMKRQYLKPFGIAMALMAFQQLTGINAVIFYSKSIFKSVGSTLDSNLCSIIIGVVNLFATIVATVLIDRLGRKILLYISNVLIVVSLISLAIFFHLKSFIGPNDEDGSWKALVDSISWLPLVNLMLYVIGFSLGWGPIPWLFMGEALPAKIRGTAASIITAFNWSFSFIITKSFPGMVEMFGEAGVFSLFAAFMVIGSLFSIFFVPETKGLSLEDIEALMANRTKPSINRKMSVVSGIVMS